MVDPRRESALIARCVGHFWAVVLVPAVVEEEPQPAGQAFPT